MHGITSTSTYDEKYESENMSVNYGKYAGLNNEDCLVSVRVSSVSTVVCLSAALSL